MNPRVVISCPFDLSDIMQKRFCQPDLPLRDKWTGELITHTLTFTDQFGTEMRPFANENKATITAARLLVECGINATLKEV